MDLTLACRFFFWCTMFSGLLLIISTVAVIFAKDWIYDLHTKWFNLSKENFDLIVYCYLGVFKIFFLTLNLVPWIAFSVVS